MSSKCVGLDEKYHLSLGSEWKLFYLRLPGKSSPKDWDFALSEEIQKACMEELTAIRESRFDIQQNIFD